MVRPAPYAQCTRSVPSNEWVKLLRLERAWTLTHLAVRLLGQNVTWRVVLNGPCGPEVLADGTIPSGTTVLVRVGSLPTTLAGAVLTIEAALPGAGSAQTVAVEASWVPAEPGEGPAENR